MLLLPTHLNLYFYLTYIINCVSFVYFKYVSCIGTYIGIIKVHYAPT